MLPGPTIDDMLRIVSIEGYKGNTSRYPAEIQAQQKVFYGAFCSLCIQLAYPAFPDPHELRVICHMLFPYYLDLIQDSLELSGTIPCTYLLWSPRSLKIILIDCNS